MEKLPASCLLLVRADGWSQTFLSPVRLQVPGGGLALLTPQPPPGAWQGPFQGQAQLGAVHRVAVFPANVPAPQHITRCGDTRVVLPCPCHVPQQTPALLCGRSVTHSCPNSPGSVSLQSYCRLPAHRWCLRFGLGAAGDPWGCPGGPGSIPTPSLFPPFCCWRGLGCPVPCSLVTRGPCPLPQPRGCGFHEQPQAAQGRSPLGQLFLSASGRELMTLLQIRKASMHTHKIKGQLTKGPETCPPGSSGGQGLCRTLP